jgi:DNA-binding CsgD family transcriptional regulator
VLICVLNLHPRRRKPQKSMIDHNKNTLKQADVACLVDFEYSATIKYLENANSTRYCHISRYIILGGSQHEFTGNSRMAEIDPHAYESLLAFVAKLDDSKTSAELRNVFQETIAPIGYKFFAYHIIQAPDIEGGSKRQASGISNYPTAWSEHYISSGYVNEDPVVQHVYQTRTPFIWQEQINPDTLSRGQKKLFVDAADLGVRNGLTIPLLPRIGETASLSLVPDKGYESSGAMRRSLNAVHILAEFFHARASRVVLEEQLGHTSRRRKSFLSKREHEALTWVARGKSSWDISHILNISEKSVEFYIDSVKKKLQASNRTQAVVKAIMLGLIDFSRE